MTRYSVSVHVGENQYYIQDENQAGETQFRPDRNGVVRVTEHGGLHVIAGTNTGSLRLTVDLLDEEPCLELDGWDEAADVGYRATTDNARLAGYPGAPVQGIPAVSHAGPGSYRIRFHMRGRDDPRNENPFTVVEEHRIAVWPSPWRSTTVHKATDDTGRRHRQ
ncbi:hypothetical protein [Jidongwangia harbinensis]|uniref:hypothetical protein n=1 Tax=Jidongwangia harbinensis TaxID=2878561 RepID=UPI001CDA2799|nr:hypothetical protein [Jidongwangia harbinensis]MCA2211691.1 hypothetical protein [Jidongwangia harbinensis]